MPQFKLRITGSTNWHVLKPETTKQNGRNETTEMSKTTKTSETTKTSKIASKYKQISEKVKKKK